MEIELPLTEPQETFVFTDEPYPAIIGGLGCVHPDTRIWTEHGLMRIADINSAIRVLSWNEKDQRFQLSLSGGAFPKGRANLYRVVTQQGEFVATSHHQIFSSCRSYRPVGDIVSGDSLLSASRDLLCSISESGLKSLPVGEGHSSQKLADLMGHCADGARLYGQQFLTAKDSGQSEIRQSACAHRLCRTACHCEPSHKDDQAELRQAHNHRDQSSSQTCKLGCDHLMAEPVEALERHASSLCAEHTLHYRQSEKQSHATSEHHHTEQELPFLDANRSLLQACKPPIVESNILAVLEAERNHVYYDLQVLDTNNYVDEFGHIHHNSGKTQGGVSRLIIRMLSCKGLNMAYYMPTYDLLRLRAIPEFESMFAKLGIKTQHNKTEYSITVKGYGRIIFRSYDNPDRIVAYEVADSIVDELDTLKKEDAEKVWRKITERNRQKSPLGNTIGCVTTPDAGIHGFVYHKWVKKQGTGYQLIKAPTYSNPFLPDGYVEQIRANYDPLLADMYIEGEFVSLSDKKVYHFFSRGRHHSERTIQPSDHLHICIDFNIGGCCSSVWVIDGNKPKAVGEFVSHDTADFINNLSKYKGHKITIYPDASGAAKSTNASESDIQMIERAGYSVDAPAANPAIRDRINAFNSLLAHDKIEVNCVECPNLANALEVQGYTDKGEPEKFKDHPSVDDWNDSAGYFIHRRFPINAVSRIEGFRVGR